MSKLTQRSFQFFQFESSISPNQYAHSFLVLTFEDKTSRNSFSLAAARELMEIVRLAEAESIQGLLFRAQTSGSTQSNVFCSGGNLKDYAKNADPNAGIVVNQEITDLLHQLSKSALVTVALVEGDCFGGGLELLSAFDEVIALPHVMFGFWQRRIGLSFGWGGGHRLARRLGDQKLIQLALQARGIFAPEAHAMALVDHVVSATAALEFAKTRLSLLTRASMIPVLQFKRLRGQMGGQMGGQTGAELESSVFEGLWWNADHREALAPFRR